MTFQLIGESHLGLKTHSCDFTTRHVLQEMSYVPVRPVWHETGCIKINADVSPPCPPGRAWIHSTCHDFSERPSLVFLLPFSARCLKTYSCFHHSARSRSNKRLSVFACCFSTLLTFCFFTFSKWALTQMVWFSHALSFKWHFPLVCFIPFGPRWPS